MTLQYWMCYCLAALPLFSQTLPSDNGGWRKFGSSPQAHSAAEELKFRTSSDEAVPEYDWDAVCDQRGYDIIFLYQRHFAVPAERMLKQAEGGWRNVLKDEEVSFNWKWKDYYKELPVTNLLLAVDERGVVFLPLKTSSGPDGQWDEVGRLHRKSWFKRRIIPILKNTSDGAWHALFMLFGH